MVPVAAVPVSSLPSTVTCGSTAHRGKSGSARTWTGRTVGPRSVPMVMEGHAPDESNRDVMKIKIRNGEFGSDRRGCWCLASGDTMAVGVAARSGGRGRLRRVERGSNVEATVGVRRVAAVLRGRKEPRATQHGMSYGEIR